MNTRSKALIIDDVEMNREILSDILEQQYTVICAEDGQTAINVMEQQLDSLAVVLLDLVMPGMDGFGVLQTMGERGWIGEVPVLMITGETDAASEMRCLELGAQDYIYKPFNRTLVELRVRNAATLFDYKHSLEEKVTEQTAQLRSAYNRLQHQNESITDLLGSVVEARNQESGEHVHRVKMLTDVLTGYVLRNHPELGMTKSEAETIVITSVLHDVGKIMISDAVLLKPGKLTPEEFDLMKQHTIMGCTVLDNAKMSWDENYQRISREICHYHHEKWDGKGYPEGLKGDEIPISAQIVSLADCFDALTQKRVYKAAFPPDVAYKMIMDGACGAFSPLMKESLTACLVTMKKICEKNP